MKKYSKLIKLSVMLVFCITVAFCFFQERELSSKYKVAVAYAEKGDYENALARISQIGEYKNSEELLTEYNNELNYVMATNYINDGKYEEAVNILTEMNGSGASYKESIALQNEAIYKYAVWLGTQGKLQESLRQFKNLPVSYMDVVDRVEQMNYAIKFNDTWYSKEHQIDFEIKAVVSEDNIPHVDLLMKDRNGFLLGDESNVLKARDLEVFDDRFNWDMFNNGTIYAVILENSDLKIMKKPVSKDTEPVVFSRKLQTFNSLDGDLNSSVSRDVDAGVK